MTIEVTHIHGLELIVVKTGTLVKEMHITDNKSVLLDDKFIYCTKQTYDALLKLLSGGKTR